MAAPRPAESLCFWQVPARQAASRPQGRPCASKARCSRTANWRIARNVVARYWPDEPACHAQGWFHTGDLATRADDGSYTVVGRARDLIISGGENIHPLEIETAVGEHPAVAECAAFGLPHDEWGESVAVGIVLHGGARLSSQELDAHLDGRLARFKLPRRVFFVQALPRTALGKLRRGALAKLVAA